MEKVIAGILFSFDPEDQGWIDLNFNYRFIYNNIEWSYSVYCGGYNNKIGSARTIDDVEDIIISYERRLKIKKLKERLCLNMVIK